MLLPCTFLSALKMSIENNMRRRSPKLLCEVLKSKNVVCMPNYNVINSYLLFSFFSFFYDNVIAIRCISLLLVSQLEPLLTVEGLCNCHFCC